MTPHVIVVDDKSSMWGNVVRTHGPYPSRDAALADQGRVNALYPRRAFIEVSELIPGEFARSTTPPPPKGKARKKLVVDCDIQGVPAEEINRMVQP